MVCTLKKITKGKEDYYLRLAREDYYTNGDEPPGAFIGKGSRKLGLSGLIHHKDTRLKLLFQGIHPLDNSVLRQGAATERTYRTKDGKEKVYKPLLAYDFTLSAPKSVSILWALSDEGTKKN